MSRELLQHALDALCLPCAPCTGEQSQQIRNAIDAIRARLAQPQAQPERGEQALGRAIDNPTEKLDDGPAIFAEFVNCMPKESLDRVPDALAKRVGEFFAAAGYGMAFGRWYRQRKSAFAQPAPTAPAVAEPLHDWEYVAMWATAAEKYDLPHDIAVEFGRAVEACCGTKGSAHG